MMSNCFVNYETQMQMVAEWWKNKLFGESKKKMVLVFLPDSANFSTDLPLTRQIRAGW
ncbi:hypothetical protein [Dubosiella newyorkensis]|uniref:hypothetical protein n=1 Tax=Dubosiella newyorkensis TaxID=1862672 RepID=UPI003F672BBE